MQVTAERINPTKVELTIEVEAEQVAKTFNEVYREYSKHTSVPGFRKGKTPRAILERYVAPESVRRRAVELLIPPAYIDAIKQEDIKPYADPEVEVVRLEEGQPFIFKAEVPLPPTVELGEYKGIEVEKQKVEITDEDVEDHLEHLRESRATSEKVEDRGIQESDVVIASISSATEGEEAGEPKRSLVQVGDNVLGFDENIMGLKVGERKAFHIDYPKDFEEEELAGKKVMIDFTVEGIRERIVPELNEEFAKEIGDFESVDALREHVRSRLIASNEESAERKVEHEIVDEIVNRSKVEFPDVMVEHEVRHEVEDLHNRLSRLGTTIEQYLQQMDKTQEEFLDDLRKQAAERIKVSLVLGEIMDEGKIEVSEEEVDVEIDRIATESETTREAVESYMEARGGRSTLRSSMLNRKLIDYLKSVSVIK